jgi:hypothetical protein
MMMMIAEDLMEDQEVVLVEEVSVVAPAVVIRAAEAVLQMDRAEIAQATDHLLVQEADAVVLQADEAVLQMDAVLQTDAVLHRQEGAAVLPAMEDVAAKKIVLLQADKFCIETIKKNRASALFFLIS